ncbi:MAG: hypothetical protein AB7L09_21285 [Nitrospira sp.]
MKPRALIQGWIYWHGKIWGKIYFDQKKEHVDGTLITTSTVNGPMDEDGIIKTSNSHYILGMRTEQIPTEMQKFCPLESEG